MDNDNIKSKYKWMKYPVWAIVLTIAGFFVSLFGVSLLVKPILYLFIPENGSLMYLMIAPSITVAALLVVYFLEILEINLGPVYGYHLSGYCLIRNYWRLGTRICGCIRIRLCICSTWIR